MTAGIQAIEQRVKILNREIKLHCLTSASEKRGIRFAIREMVEEIEKLLNFAHYHCEDSWYSCPKSVDGCCDSSEGTECNCNAEKREKDWLSLKERLNKITGDVPCVLRHGGKADEDRRW